MVKPNAITMIFNVPGNIGKNTDDHIVQTALKEITMKTVDFFYFDKY